MTILIDGKQLNFFKFPGGEIQVNVNNVFGSKIICLLKSSDEIMALILAVNAIKNTRNINISLYIYYFPYSRQDRVCSSGEAFSLKMMCKLINDLECDEVYIIDPHSDVLPALLNNCKIITLKQILSNFDFTGLTICCPDAGAIKRISTITTDDSSSHTKFQCHDFSCRGMSGLHDGAISGAAHLTSFEGTDTVSSLDLCEVHYDNGIAGFSVPATEHSVMCIGVELNEIATIERIIFDVYPSGIVSVVSDSWDFWKVITEYLPILKERILKRNGKVVIRPDSGDPVKIICGDEKSLESYERKGAIECLWEIFGGKINSKGYKVLDSHIGLIYGDAITLSRAEQILSILKYKGFSSENIVFGVGSYTYQYVTRDTYGLAMKATSGLLNGERVDIFKDPKTGSKKSAKGLLRVEFENDKYVLHEQQTKEQEKEGCLKTVFLNGKTQNRQSLSQIRNLISNAT